MATRGVGDVIESAGGRLWPLGGGGVWCVIESAGCR